MKSKSKPAPKSTTKPPASNRRIFICLPEEYLTYKLLIGEAIYLYMWCIYRTTAEYAADAHGGRIGLIYNGAPVKDPQIANELGCSEKSIQRWRKKAEENGLIRTKQVGRGIIYAVLDSYKFSPEDVRPSPPDWTTMSTLKK